MTKSKQIAIQVWVFLLSASLLIVASACDEEKDQQIQQGIQSFHFSASLNPALSQDVHGQTQNNDSAVFVVPDGTDRSNLIASFDTQGSVLHVGSTLQESGKTPNDFNSPVIYKVLDAEGNLLRAVRVAVEYQGEIAAHQGQTASQVIDPNSPIQDIVPSVGQLLPSFHPDTKDYKVNVGRHAFTMTITPKLLANVNAQVNGIATANNTASHVVHLNFGYNLIFVDIVPQSGESTRYLIHVIRHGGENANLVDMHVSYTALEPQFAPETTSYTGSVGSEVTQVSVTVTAEDPGSTITVNGGDVTSGSPSPGIVLPIGESNIAVEVTSQDGNTKKVYNVKINKAAGNNANLSSITISPGTLSPQFSAENTSYTVEQDNQTESMTVTVNCEDPNARVDVNGSQIGCGGSANVPLQYGQNSITITVTAEDGTTSNSYTVTANRPANTNARLSNIALSQGAINPVFSPDTTSYSVSYNRTVESITVTPTAEDSSAKITVNGTDVASGSASPAIALALGQTQITVAVTAQDGSTNNSYTINATKLGDDNANLAMLVVSEGTLNPVFNPQILAYDVNVVKEINFVTVTATVDDPDASIVTNGHPAQSAQPSHDIYLNFGPNILTCLVTAKDGQSQSEYIIKVHRAGQDNANLTALTVSAGNLTPAFHTTETNYQLMLDPNINEVVVSPTSLDVKAKITVNGQQLDSGQNSAPISAANRAMINVTVTSQDGSKTQTYAVQINKNASNAPGTSASAQ